MGFRTYAGYTVTENGWRICDRDEIVQVTVPGTTQQIEVRRGDAATILVAWMCWYHLNVEPIDLYKPRDDWGWSATNDVPNSNHLSGTAVDINATQYPWQRLTMGADKVAKVRRGLELFEGTIFWGRDWDRKDEMHYQLNFHEGHHKNTLFAEKLNNNHLGIYGEPTTPAPAAPLPVHEGTFWADISQYQPVVDDSYPHRVLVARSNSGDRTDTNFLANARWAKQALDSGRLDAFGAYYFFWPGQANCDLHKSLLEQAGLWGHPKVFSMVDVEGAPDAAGNKRIRGDQSFEINDEVFRLQGWYGDRRRVIGYLNPTADPDLWATRPIDLKFVVPHYNNSPGNSYDFPGRFAHQYSDRVDCAPFGPCDANFTGMNLTELLDMLGIAHEGADDLTPEQDRMLRYVYDELSKQYPSRSDKRVSDDPVDTLAGFVLNIDGRIHEQAVEDAQIGKQLDAILVALEAVVEALKGKK